MRELVLPCFSVFTAALLFTVSDALLGIRIVSQHGTLAVVIHQSLLFCTGCVTVMVFNRVRAVLLRPKNALLWDDKVRWRGQVS